MRTMTQTDRDDLENLIDSVGLFAVLESVSGIASEKADHIRASYQDPQTANCWDCAALAIEISTRDEYVRAVSR